MGTKTSRMGVPAGWKGNKPRFWNPQKALTFCDAANLIDVFLDTAVPFSREMLLLIFFHETAFSLIAQGEGGPGFGFGQLELDNPKNPNAEFLHQEFGTSNRQAVVDTLNDDGERAVEMHCNFLKFLMGRQAKEGKTPSQGSLLQGQVGAKNAAMITNFNTAELKLKGSIYSSQRSLIIEALNSCRFYLPKGGVGALVHLPVPQSLFSDYWNFTLPESDLVLGIRK